MRYLANTAAKDVRRYRLFEKALDALATSPYARTVRSWVFAGAAAAPLSYPLMCNLSWEPAKQTPMTPMIPEATVQLSSAAQPLLDIVMCLSYEHPRHGAAVSLTRRRPGQRRAHRDGGGGAVPGEHRGAGAAVLPAAGAHAARQVQQGHQGRPRRGLLAQLGVVPARCTALALFSKDQRASYAKELLHWQTSEGVIMG